MLFNLNLNLLISQGGAQGLGGKIALSSFIGLGGIACDVSPLPIPFYMTETFFFFLFHNP